jgi:uncharacterized membrane protein
MPGAPSRCLVDNPTRGACETRAVAPHRSCRILQLAAAKRRATNQGEHMASRTSNKVLMAAIAGLLTVGALETVSTAHAAEAAKVKCHGVNSCKGSGGCAGAGHGCAGKNACKGQGFVEMSKDDCMKQGGRLTEAGPPVK